MGEFIEIRDLSKHFPVKDQSASFSALNPFSSRHALLRAVDGVSFFIRKGETLGLVGESGCGKSTVARCLLRLLEPTRGKIFFENTDLTGLKGESLRLLRKAIQMIFQDPMASLNPRLSVRQVLEEPLRLHETLTGKEREERVGEVMAQVGLDRELLNRFPHELSGGQRQRVNIARAIATRPKFVVLDEPTSGMSPAETVETMDLIQEISKTVTLLLIEHDMNLVMNISQKIIVLDYGNKIAEGTPQEICSHQDVIDAYLGGGTDACSV